MSLWGNKDTAYSTGNITTITSGGVVTGSGTTFTDSTLVVAGQVIEMGAYGSGVIKSVDSNTQLTLDSAAGLSGVSGITLSFNISESPKYLAKDSHWAGNEVYGSDTAEVGALQEQFTNTPTQVGLVSPPIPIHTETPEPRLRSSSLDLRLLLTLETTPYWRC